MEIVLFVQQRFYELRAMVFEEVLRQKNRNYFLLSFLRNKNGEKEKKMTYLSSVDSQAQFYALPRTQRSLCVGPKSVSHKKKFIDFFPK